MERGEAMNVQMICNRIFCLVDGFVCELERVCEEHIDIDLPDDICIDG